MSVSCPDEMIRPSGNSLDGGAKAKQVLNCVPCEDSLGSYEGGVAEVCFHTLDEPSRDAVMAKDGSGRSTARTCDNVSSSLSNEVGVTYITCMPCKDSTQLEVARCHAHKLFRDGGVMVECRARIAVEVLE